MVEHSEHGAEACHVCALREIERLRAEVKRLDDGWTDCVWHLQSAHKAMGVWKPALVAAEADRDRLRAALVEVRSRAKILDSATLLDVIRTVDAAIGRDAVPASGGHTMDEGPWTVIRDKVSGYGIGVGSDDFKRDVLLRVDGDFGCGVEKTDYCAWLARTLNQIGGRSHCPHCGQWHNMDAGC